MRGRVPDQHGGALFGPSKYGLLPELLPEQRLSWGNGIIELGTFLASIARHDGGRYLAERFAGTKRWSGILLLGFTCVGLVTSFGISRVPAADPTQDSAGIRSAIFATQMKTIRADRVLSAGR